jgi:hypothetical protein
MRSFSRKIALRKRESAEPRAKTEAVEGGQRRLRIIAQGQ